MFPEYSLDILGCALAQIPKLFRLPAVQTRRDGERRIHAHYPGIEVQLRDALEAARRTFLDAHAATLAVIHQNFVQAVRTHIAHDARLGTNEVTVVARIAGAATEAAPGFLHRLLFRERLNHFVLRLAPRLRRQQRLLHAREVRE